jgi:hypothetical protein
MNYSVTSQRVRPQFGKSKPGKQAKGSFSQLGYRIIGWLIMGGVSIGVIWLLAGWGKGQLGKLWPLHQAISVVLVDPHPGSGTSPWLMQLQPDTKTVTLIALPTDQTTELFSGYGQYKLSAVYPLLNLDHRSPAYIRATFSAISQILVTAVEPWSELPNWQQQVTKTGLLTPQPAAAINRNQAQQLGRQPLAALATVYWQKIWSPGLKWSDRVQNFQAWKRISQWRWFTEQSDVQWVWSTDLKAISAGNESAADQCPIAVINATEIKGLARQISNVLTANGYSTVRTTVDPVANDQSHIWLDPATAELCQSVAVHVSTILPTAPKPEINGEITKLYRAPIVIVVGGDITN